MPVLDGGMIAVVAVLIASLLMISAVILWDRVR